MIADLTLDGFVDVADALGLPLPGLVEKDFHVVNALRALSALATCDPGLVFGGGTSLCRAYRLIQRMSEDIDLRIVSAQHLTAGARRKFRNDIVNCLQTAGFQFDPADQEHLAVHDSGRTFTFNLAYAPLAEPVESLRPGVKIEISSWPLKLKPVTCSIKSFWNEAHGAGAEVQAIPCVAVTETAADKFVALTRRIAYERSIGSARDGTLLRHVYDLYQLRPMLNLADLGPVIKSVMASDRDSRGKNFPDYEQNPAAVSRGALKALSDDIAYAETFKVFQRDMVYGDAVEFAACLPVLNELAALLDT